MFAFLVTMHILLCIGMVVIVLLQVGKGQGLGGLFGSGGSGQTIFGAHAGDVLTKATTFIAVFWMVLCVSLAVLSSRRTSSLVSDIEKIAPAETSTEEKDAVETSSVESSTEEKPAVETSTAESSTEEKDAIDTSSVESSTEEKPAIAVSAAESSEEEKPVE
ncbi:MAG: preprotein translocase subunit SecG [Candidatus Aureabacteria bacterium]|nr:preprotein translocase subunit SecG [Candidatus Auribacterota bacterium]